MIYRYAGIIKNDIAAAPGVCVSFFTQGCPHRCPECHNPETWDFNGGKEFTDDVIREVIEALNANGINRTLCIMGGEPLCKENLFVTSTLIYEVKQVYPDKKIFLWTGYTIEELEDYAKEYEENSYNRSCLCYIKDNITCLIDGRYDKDLRDITLIMRGSSNQRIFYLD